MEGTTNSLERHERLNHSDVGGAFFYWFSGGNVEPVEFDGIIEKVELIPIKLLPGDALLVLVPPRMLTPRESDILAERLGKIFPKNKVFIAPLGIEIQIISEHENEA